MFYTSKYVNFENNIYRKLNSVHMNGTKTKNTDTDSRKFLNFQRKKFPGGKPWSLRISYADAYFNNMLIICSDRVIKKNYVYVPKFFLKYSEVFKICCL